MWRRRSGVFGGFGDVAVVGECIDNNRDSEGGDIDKDPSESGAVTSTMDGLEILIVESVDLSVHGRSE